jgi:hypothetical protein
MDNSSLWGLMRGTHRSIIPTYEPLHERFCVKNGLDTQAVGWLLTALTLEPDTSSPERLLVRGPYTAAQVYEAQLARLARMAFMTEVAPLEYRLTTLGRDATSRLIAELRAAMAAADPLPLEDSLRIANLLGRLVRACLDTPPPPDTWSIDLAARLMPAAEPPLPYTEQAISCLHGYRDDAHLSAWQPSGMTAPALEALTLLCRGEADSLDELATALSHRGHPRQVYAEAFQELRLREFIEGEDDFPIVTEAGSDFRREVEAETDRLFYAPWKCLEPDEKDELYELLTRLKSELAFDV